MLSGDHATNSTPAQAVIGLKIPIITLVLAATVAPVEWRSLGNAALGFSIEPTDVAANIAGFAAVGVVLAESGFLKAVAIGALISACAEASQFFMAHRDPSAIDVMSNVIGTIFGAGINRYYRLGLPELVVGKWKAVLAASLAALIVVGVWVLSGGGINTRGVTTPGTLEAYWKFDERGGRLALDSSGHKLQGSFRNQPRRVAGVRGGGLMFDGVGDCVDAGHSTAFRLAGSMTISAWINPSSFPEDDAAIVSQLGDKLGYQLDTTVDKGIRGIGFKLTNSCGDLMARYGKTRLASGIWYHVAGVYDAENRTMDVYLNGKLDNGILVGAVTGKQRSSRSAVYIGRRSDRKGFEFAGSLDDVRIYSVALNKEEVLADMLGEMPEHTSLGHHTQSNESTCGLSTEYEDSKIPAATALIGVLVAIACAGFRPSGRLSCVLASFVAGLCVIPFLAPSIPQTTRFMMSVVSLAGGTSVAISMRHPRTPAL